MAKKKSYDEVSVVRSLSKIGSIYINTVEKRIDVVRDNTDVGNGSWGKIDYLVKVHGYTYQFVKGVNKKRIAKRNEDIKDEVNTKANKREAKLNMAAMSKAAMKKVKTK
jgi:hypothetical protein